MWEAVQDANVDHHDDRRALDALLAAVPPEMQFSLSNKRTAKEAWEAIAASRIDSDRSRKAALQALRKEWDDLAFKPGEDVDDFALRLNTLLQKMERFGDAIYNEERAVEKLFRCVPTKYKQIARSIESLLDLSTMSIEEAIGRLKVVDFDEPQLPSGSITTAGKLLLTRERWDAGHGDRKKGESSSASGGRRRDKPARGAKTARSGCKVAPAEAPPAGPREEEPALFMAHASIELRPAAPTATAPLHLDEPKAHALLGDGSDTDKTGGWCLDTGATHHMTGQREFFAELDSDVRGSVKFGDASTVEIQGIGSVIFAAKTGEHRMLTGVYYIPAPRNSIISLGQLDESGSRVLIEHGILRIWDRHRRLLAKVTRGANRLYVLDVQVAQPLCLAARRDDEAWQWHERFGHLHFEALKRLSSKEMVRGLPCLEHVEQFCDVCVVTKQRRLPFPQQASFRAKEKLELMHGDLCGPVTPATPGGRRYFLLLVDDFSRYMRVVLLSSKGEAADAIRRTQRHYSAPYSPQQNGVVERRNQTVVGMAQALLKQRGMPAVFWGEAVLTAVYILNRSPTKALDSKTPYEAWHGRTPAVSHLRVFGCLAFAKELGHIGKLDDRSTPGVFIGYAEGSKAYRILDPKTQRVRTARDVVFNEGRGWAWDKAVDDGSTPTYDDFIVEYVHFEGAGGAGISSSPSMSTSVPKSPSVPVAVTPTTPQLPTPPTPRALAPAVTPPGTSTPALAVTPPGTSTPASAVTPPGTSTPAPARVEHSPVEFASPLAHDEERIDAYYDGEPLRYRTMEGLLGDQPVPGPVPRNLEAQLQLACDDGVYVDDLVITGTKDAEVAAFKEEMKAAFQMSDLGLLSFYLGIEVHQDHSGIKLRQTAYAKRVVELAGLTDCNLALTPMEERLKLSRDSTAEEVDATQYRRLVGSLRYLAHTRPDLAFSIGYISRFMQRPTTEHQQAVKRIVRYVARTLDHGLYYPRCPGVAHFVGYRDSDHAGDIDTSKSTSGILFFLGKCLVSWQSVKQQVVAMSSCEAEYIAASTACTQALWLARLLGDLLGRDTSAVQLMVDSKSALALAKNPVFHERSKHIRVRYHFIRRCLDEGSITASYINTKDQLAGLLTKPLGWITFLGLCSRIGIVQPSHKTTHKT
uniref:Uncharacterized protein n=1 Tax=Avena sativa TaxID=4498 RepID=A0ACD5UHC9_AVESA